MKTFTPEIVAKVNHQYDFEADDHRIVFTVKNQKSPDQHQYQVGVFASRIGITDEYTLGQLISVLGHIAEGIHEIQRGEV
jgi:hypothetical protein